MSGSWAEANRHYTATALRRIAVFLGDGPDTDVVDLDTELDALAAAMDRPPAIVTVGEAFGLSRFERDTLLLCAGIELDDAIRCTLVQGRGDGASHAAATFGLALATLPGSHWSALTPASPLRRWQLVELGPGPSVTSSPLTVSERVLHHLAGVHYVDESSGLRPAGPAPELAPAQATVATEAAATLAARCGERLAALQLVGRRPGPLRSTAATVAEALELRAATVHAEDLPSAPADREALARQVERESVLARLLPVLDCMTAERDAVRLAARFADSVAGPVVVLAPHPVELARRDVRFTVPSATAAERRAAWEAALGPAPALEETVERISELFDLDQPAIASTAAELHGRSPAADEDRARLLWTLARDRARPRLEQLTERVVGAAGWNQLVLPEPQLRMVREIAQQTRFRGRVYGEWAFGGPGSPGRGISALFSGPSGTGKTLTAGIIAGELDLDLYRIDLSRVVSKYIGETEKNLGTVFDEAEGAGAILLFDEADALFGKRSEVRDSHDRYANLEVSYLLQRMEAYDGLAILTTNQRNALDPAFLRRIRFSLQFPFPDQPARAEIWRTVFPPEAPTDGLDVDRLSRLDVSGGNIRNMALNAAFAAAAAGSPVRMCHLLVAARAEFAKLERPLPEAEVRGWA